MKTRVVELFVFFLCVALAYFAWVYLDPSDNLNEIQQTDGSNRNDVEVDNGSVSQVDEDTSSFDDALVEGVCDSDELEQMSLDIVNQTEFDNNYWELVGANFVTEMDSFASSDRGMVVSDCGYRITYTSQIDNPKPHNLSGLLIDTLSDRGWIDDMGLKLISDSTGASTTIGLHHADGPGGSQHIMAYPMYDERSVRFASVAEKYNYVNYKEMISGERDNPCPCSTAVTLIISEPVSFSQYMR